MEAKQANLWDTSLNKIEMVSTYRKKRCGSKEIWACNLN